MSADFQKGAGAAAVFALLLCVCLAEPSSGAEKATGLKLSGKGPVQIESDNLEVRENENLAIFTGNVAVVQDKTLLKAGKLTVYYANDGGSATTGTAKIERLEATGKVYMKSDNQVATGDAGRST
jgi:lipopolysaccharide export system protein LptA